MLQNGHPEDILTKLGGLESLRRGEAKSAYPCFSTIHRGFVVCFPWILSPLFRSILPRRSAGESINFPKRSIFKSIIHIKADVLQ